MERIRELDRYQKIVLLVVCVLLVVFTAVYAVTTSQEGYAYRSAILIPRREDGATVYEGTVEGAESFFRVTDDHTVTYSWGGKTYGPYTAREDPTAKPEGMEYTTGVEILENGEVFFRGGVYRSGEYLMLFNEDGGISMTVTAVMGDGTRVDGDGNVVDHMAPAAATILELLEGPKLSHRGIWLAWVCGVFMCAMTAVSILFADELFRWNMSFKVADAYAVEPSEWTLAGRYISWAILPILILGVFLMGLQTVV